jgi:predicted acyltransferase
VVNDVSEPAARGAGQRLQSLDLFRGITIAAMILVSTPGTWTAVYPPLDHAIWNGWTPTDLVFPFLLFAMGAAVPMALGKRRTQGRATSRYVLRRVVVLFLLGFALNAMEAKPPVALETFRIPGVLQRIAIVYLAVALLADALSLRAQIAVAVSALIGYWIAMTRIPVPGAGAGVLTPDGNLASFIDGAVFGRHMLASNFDPEGLLSTIPAIATALLGTFAGTWLSRTEYCHRTLWLWAAGAAATAAGFLWGRVFPINKTLWTSSFALFSAGFAAQALALCHGLVEFGKGRAATPFVAFGRNALPAYFLSVGLDSVLSRVSIGGAPSVKALLFRLGFASWLRPCCGAEAASFGYAITYVALWTVVFAAMYRRRIFIGI